MHTLMNELMNALRNSAVNRRDRRVDWQVDAQVAHTERRTHGGARERWTTHSRMRQKSRRQ